MESIHLNRGLRGTLANGAFGVVLSRPIGVTPKAVIRCTTGNKIGAVLAWRAVAKDWDRALLTALGPGFSAEFVVLGEP